MTLRIGYSNCCKHLNKTEVQDRISHTIEEMDESMFTLIFYDLELSRDGEIEQLSAFTDAGDNFSVYIRTAVRTNTSPNLKVIPPMIYSALACEPLDAMSRFIEWIRLQHCMNTNGDTDMNNVILAAHYGSCHDHVYLLRTMMSWGISPPTVRFSDTLALFKVIKGANERANLSTLAVHYAGWVQHMPHDADSDARILRIVVMSEFVLARKACHVFSSSFTTFMERTGLNMHGIRPVYTSKDNDIYTDPDLDSTVDSEGSLEDRMSVNEIIDTT